MDLYLTSNRYYIDYQTEDSAGLDLPIPWSETIEVGETKLVNTEVRMQIPKGFYGLLVPRSSIHKKGLILVNFVGIIDSDYRGDIMFAYKNISDQVVELEQGERIGQVVITPYQRFDNIYDVPSLDTTERGEGGFGSTGE